MHRFKAVALFLLIASTLSPLSAFAQGRSQKMRPAPLGDFDEDQPQKRAEWNRRGREAPKGQSAAALRLRAHQQKMAMRAQRAAAAKMTGNAFGGVPQPWVKLGPAPLVSDASLFGDVSGRSTAIAIDPSDATGNTVYAAAASGGVWKSTNAANAVVANVTWTPVTDQQASLTNGAISVKPDGTVVLVGTGEPNNAIDSYFGVGILRSINKGGTWSLITSGDGGTHPFAGLGFSKFAWLPGSNTVVGATMNTPLGFEEGNITGSTSRGLYLSTDNGQTWAYQAPTDGSSASSVTDVVYNATAGKFFAALRYHGVYSSTNGTSWTRLTNQPNPTALTLANCPTAAVTSCPMYRGQFSVVPGRNEMYFWFVNINDTDGGIWQSTDGGTSWKQIDETGITVCGDVDSHGNPVGCGTTQAFYNLEISAVADGTATDIYAGAVNLFRCKLASGATTCSTVDANLPNSWLNLTHVYGTCNSKAKVHPDEHGLDFLVVGGKDIMYFGNDGGVYRALDGYTGLNIGSCSTAGNNQFDNLNATIGSMTQFVSFSVHPTDQNTVLGGTQDNGSPATTTATTSSQFFTALGGDGGYNAIDPTTPANWYNAFTDVQIGVCTTAPACNDNVYFLVADNTFVGNDGGSFYTPYILDPQNSATILIGTCRLWRGPVTGTGTGFVALSNDFDGSVPPCGGFQAGENDMVRGIAAGGPKDTNGLSKVIYATTEGTGPNAGAGGGHIFVTTNAGITQMSNVTGSTNPSSYVISSVAIDNSDATANTAYVGIMGFNVSHVFKTTTAGSSAWSDWSGSGVTALPDSPVNALLVDSQAGKIYAGTDVGIFVSSTSSAGWTEVGPAPSSGQAGYLPNVPVTAIRMFNSGGVKKLRASTYGRGIWEFNLAVGSATTTTVASNVNPANQGVAVTFTATVTTTGSNPPTGNVTFNDGITALGTAALSTVSGSQVATLTTSTLAVGSHSITAVYAGDANNAGSTSNTLTQTINAVTTTTTVTSNLNPANQGDAVTFTAKVTTSGTHAPTGNVTFNDGTTALGTVALSTVSGSQVATLTTSALAVGSHSITAVYAGDANNAGSTSTTLTQTINAVTTTTTVVSSKNPANLADSVTFTAKVTTTGTHAPTGNVTFKDGTTALGTSALGTVGGFQVATFTTATLTVGTHSITAAYAGDVNNSGSTSSALSQVITPPTFTFVNTPATPTSHTVLAGQTTKSYSFTATPTSGATFVNAVNLSCTSFAPADPTLTNGSCTFSPSATIAAGSSASTVTMTITSKGPNSGIGSVLQHRSDNRLPWLPLSLPLAGVVVVGLVGRKMSRLTTVAGMFLMLALAGFLIACGSSSNPISFSSVTGSSSSIFPQNNGWTNTTATFTATLVNDSGNKGVTWAVSTANGGTIASADATHGTYTPPTIAANLPGNVTITATSVADTSKTGTASIALNPTTVPNAGYTVTVTATETGATTPTPPTVTLVVN